MSLICKKYLTDVGDSWPTFLTLFKMISRRLIDSKYIKILRILVRISKKFSSLDTRAKSCQKNRIFYTNRIKSTFLGNGLYTKS